MRELLTIFPLFLSIGMIISGIFYIWTGIEEFLTFLVVYYMITVFFLFVNYLEVSAILETFFGIKDRPFLNFLFSVLSLFYYIPYYLLTIFEKTGFFRKEVIFLSFVFPLPVFFIWCYMFYSWIVEKS